MPQTNSTQSSGNSDRDALRMAFLEESENMDLALSRLAASMLREAAIDLSKADPAIRQDAQEWIDSGEAASLSFGVCVRQVFDEIDPDTIEMKMKSDSDAFVSGMMQYLRDKSDHGLGKVIVMDGDDLSVDQENEQDFPK